MACAFDGILLDINLGTMDTGEDVMRRLRLLPPYADRPIIAFTAYALPGDRERFLSGGFDGYFAKPFTRDTLMQTVTDALGTDSMFEEIAPTMIDTAAAPVPATPSAAAPSHSPSA